MYAATVWETLRQEYHHHLCAQVVRLDAQNRPNNADKSSRLSTAIARALWQFVAQRTGCTFDHTSLPPQSVGKAFEAATRDYLQRAFATLRHLRPGRWRFYLNHRIEEFAQYRHLAELSRTLREHPTLHAALGDYLIAPDILIAREPVPDEEINISALLVEGRDLAGYTSLRAVNNETPLLHASVSCKWTIRSDRSQNVRTEGLNLIRNRKGHTPHIAVVTAEPLPGRLASLTLGTGDLDMVYHIALPELIQAVEQIGDESAQDLLATMISGQRLRDISDLPFDLAA